MAGKRGFGNVRKLPSGRWQASYIGPDTRRHSAPDTFDTKADAETWLSLERPVAQSSAWLPPKVRRERSQAANAAEDFERFSRTFIDNRLVRGRALKPRTREHYAYLLDRFLLPTFGGLEVSAITPQMVEHWHEATGIDHPTARAHSYSLLRAILGEAVRRGDIRLQANPCQIRGAGNPERASKTKVLGLDELGTLTKAMPERYRAMVQMATWCALRFGELTALRRQDIDLKHQVVKVQRAAVRVGGQIVADTTKSRAGIRTVAMPPHLAPLIQQHLDDHVAAGKDALLFPAADGTSFLSPSTLYKSFYKARDVIGRSDLRFHDLRHTGAVLAAQSGATLAELMGRLGHATPGAAMRYQSVAANRDRELAQALSKLAGH